MADEIKVRVFSEDGPRHVPMPLWAKALAGVVLGSICVVVYFWQFQSDYWTLGQWKIAEPQKVVEAVGPAAVFAREIEIEPHDFTVIFSETEKLTFTVTKRRKVWGRVELTGRTDNPNPDIRGGMDMMVLIMEKRGEQMGVLNALGLLEAEGSELLYNRQ